MSAFKNGRIARALARRANVPRGLVVALLAGLSISGCDVHGISDPGSLSSIIISPNPQTLVVNGTQQFVATGRDFEGANVPITPVWSIVAGGGAVNATGLFTAGTAPGTFAATVKATSGELSATATVIVTPGPLASIVVSPNPTSMAIGTTQQFLAVGKDAFGNVVQFTPSWSVVAGGGALSDTGLFTAGMVSGTFANTVQASDGSISGTATVTVTPGPLATITVTPNPTSLNVGESRQFTAVGQDAGGNVVPITPLWSVVASGGAISTSGLFTAGTAPGTYENTVKATSGSISGTATVTVTAGPLATISVTPNPATLGIGGTQQFTAVGRDVGGNVVAISPTWGVVAGGGSIDLSSGLFTAGSASGTYTNTVRASVGNLAGFATVVVTNGALASIIVSPNPVSVQTNATQQFTAVGMDSGGNTFTITPVWSVVNGGGTINASSGVFTAGTTAGTFTNTVQATSGSISGAATVTVTAVAPSLATIIVSPNPATVLPNGTQQFSAVGLDGNGDIFPLSPVWTVVNGGGGIDASTGLFTAGAVAGTFTNTVTATSGAISSTATVIVTAVPPSLATIIVSPDPATMLPNGTRQFSAIGLDGNGNPFPLSPVWTVVNGGGGIDASTGLFTAGAVVGTFTKTVVATSGAISDTATVIVTAVPALATITVTPDPATMLADSTRQFVAVGRDGSGNIFPITPVWTVVNGGGSIVDSTGLFTAGSVAGTFTKTVVATSGAISDSATVTVTAAPPPPPLVDLKTAAPNGIMAGASVTCVIGGTINADVSISPGNTITGFPPCVITGVQHLGDAVAAQGQLDLKAAYDQLAAMPCPPANAISANLGGTTQPAGVYCTASGIGVTGTLTLDGGGDPNATFVFQAGTSLITAGNVVLINSAQAKNVYWQVGTSATLGTGSQWQGNILALTSITLVDFANLVGRALARNGSVTLGTNNVIILP